ncbi:hypothetical protein BH24BAC1_BH24BAC1_21770 [soil metagenome]
MAKSRIVNRKSKVPGNKSAYVQSKSDRVERFGAYLNKEFTGKSHGKNPKAVHVIADGKDWAVIKQGAAEADFGANTKNKASEEAKLMLSNDLEVIIHNIDGSVERRIVIDQTKGQI